MPVVFRYIVKLLFALERIIPHRNLSKLVSDWFRVTQ